MMKIPAPTEQQWCELNNVVDEIEENFNVEYLDYEATLGDFVFDEVSGFTGQVTGIHHILGGTTCVEVQPKCKNTNVLPQAEWFGLDNLSEVKQ